MSHILRSQFIQKVRQIVNSFLWYFAEVIAGPPLRTRYVMLDDVGPSLRCLSRGHISKSKQDSPIVTMNTI